MPSDVKPVHAGNDVLAAAVEPPSVKLVVRLFVIPLFIVAAAVGVMFLIGLLAGGSSSVEEAMERLKRPGGERTADWLIGPGAKQRYMDAKTVSDKIRSGMTLAERITFSEKLTEILDKHTQANEGEVRHFLLLALGRTWQIESKKAGESEEESASRRMNSPQATGSRQATIATLMRYADAPEIPTRKAALLAMVYLAGHEEAKIAIPKLVSTVRDQAEDVDVRMAAATALGPLADPEDRAVIAALESAMRETDPRQAELVWSAALSLAQLDQTQVADTILKLLDREELSELQYYDRETDPKNPILRKLSDQEQQRILINTMIGAKNLNAPAVQEKLKQLAENDPSPRVRAAGKEILQGGGGLQP